MIRIVAQMSVDLGLGAHDLARIISTAPARYKVYAIPKRSGGTRIIAQPSSELKAIQRYLLESLFPKFPIHPAAAAYVEGRGIADNAAVHLHSRALLKLDFREFFPSIVVRDWTAYARRSQVSFESGEIEALARILFWGRRSIVPKCLSIGAPTSPALSNILMYALDEKFAEAAARLELRYTRYADDITVSGNDIRQLARFEATARKIIQATKSPTLEFNESKRGMYTRGQRRMVTGLIVTPDEQVSIGRERKRLISAMIHQSKVGRLDLEGKSKLKGLLGFCIATEPTFVSRMRVKYGDEIVDEALRFDVPSRVLRTR